MCLGENSAHHAESYFNAQLAELWNTSKDCVEKSGPDVEPLNRVRYDFALSKFHVDSRLRSGTNDNAAFSAIFGKPTLKFVCNHQAVLYLQIEKGHLYLDYDWLDESDDPPNNVPKKQDIKDKNIAFRMDFGVHRIGGHSKISDSAHIMQLLVLDFQKANLVSKFSTDVPGMREGLEYYMKKYLEFLHNAGLHVLFSPPDFDDDRYSLKIDYSVVTNIFDESEKVNLGINEIFGISVVEINKFLSTKWLESILYSDDDRHTRCLSEYHSTWTSLPNQSDIHFKAKFGPPKIKALCGTEVILYFEIEEVDVYESSDFSVSVDHYSNWMVPVVCDAISDDEGSITTRIKLDMSTVRYCEHIPSLKKDDKTVKKILDFIIYHYTAEIEKSYYHYIYNVNTVEIDGGFFPSSPPGSEITVMYPTHPSHDHRQELLIEISQLSGFDFIQIIYGYTIAEQFIRLWKSATDEHTRCLKDWSFKEVSITSFGAIDIRLLSSKKAIVWIQIEKGSIEGSGGPEQVTDWSVAFEVDLKIIDHKDLRTSTAKTWYSRFESSPALKQHGQEEYRHLCLDFENARFLYNISKFRGLTLRKHKSVSNMKTIVKYLREDYFSTLADHGHLILQSVPTWTTDTQNNSMSLTSVDFQVYSKYKFDLYRSQHISQSSDAFIVFLGMTCSRSSPPVPSEQVFKWVLNIKGDYSLGFIEISKSRFITEQLLRALSRVNASTTIVPIFPGSKDYEDSVDVIKSHGGWKLALTTWARRYPQDSGPKCDWKDTKVIDNKYVWDHSDVWSHKHEGAMDDADNGTYTVECFTKNHLQLPTSFKNGSMEVVMRGETSVEIGFRGEDRHWNVKGTSKWTIALVINSPSRGGGVSFEIRGDIKPRFDVPLIQGETSNSLDLERLRSLLEIDPKSLVVDLEKTFGGAWGYCIPGMDAYSLCNPILNNQGDVLFELQRLVAPSQLPGQTSGPLLRGSSEGQRPSLKGGASIQGSESSDGKTGEGQQGNGENQNGSPGTNEEHKENRESQNANSGKANPTDKSPTHNRTTSSSSTLDGDPTLVGT